MNSESQNLTSATLSRINLKKKRPLNLLNHRSEVAKRRRNSGLSYTGKNGAFHENLPPPAPVISFFVCKTSYAMKQKNSFLLCLFV